MSQVDLGRRRPSALAQLNAAPIPMRPDFRPIQLGLPVEDESRPAVNRAARFIQLLLLHAVLVHAGPV